MDQISDPSTETPDVSAHDHTPHVPERALALYAADRADEHFPAHILRRETGFYLLHLDTALAEGRKLIMRDGAFRFELEVISNQPHEEGGFAIGCRVLVCRKGNVRQEWRLPVSIPAKVTLLLSRKTTPAEVRNTSPFGMGIEMPMEVRKDTAITVETRDGFGYGEVRYCRQMANGKYFVGLYLREYMQHQESSVRQFIHALRRSRISLLHSWRRFRNPEDV